MTKRVYWDAGHGGSDPGATGNGLKEKDLTLKIVNYAASYLEDNYTGFIQRKSRTGDSTKTLSQRTNDANNWGADVFVSAHINAGGGIGYEDFIFDKASSTSNASKLQNSIHKEVAGSFTKNRGKKKANFHVLRETKMAAVLTENGFIDNKTDAAILSKNANLKKIGEAHARGVANYLGLKKKETPKKPSTTTTTTTVYTVKKGDTLSSIASKHKTTVKKLQDLNNIKDANKIFPGQKLKVSGIAAKYYTIKKGDVISRIAEKQNTTVAAIKKLNPSIKNINLIHPGQKIRVK